MAMRTKGKMLALGFIVLLAVAFLVDDSNVIRYPNAEIIFERGYYSSRKIFQVSEDSFESIDHWYDVKLKDAPHAGSSGFLEANISCSSKKWSDGRFTISVIICNHPDRRTISTQVSKL